MDELVSELLHFLARILLIMVRFVIALLWASAEIVVADKITWYLGWPVIKMITLGYFPKEGFYNSQQASSLTQVLVGLVGISYPLYLAYLLVLYLKT